MTYQEPERIPVSDETDELLTTMALELNLGRSSVLELAIHFMGEAAFGTNAPPAAHNLILSMILEKRQARNTIEIARDALDVEALARRLQAAQK